MDEVDYDVRMVAYQQLLPGAWAAMERWQALPLLHQALADLRDADDLALRHAAAQVQSPRPSPGLGFRQLVRQSVCAVGQIHQLSDDRLPETPKPGPVALVKVGGLTHQRVILNSSGPAKYEWL